MRVCRPLPELTLKADLGWAGHVTTQPLNDTCNVLAVVVLCRASAASVSASRFRFRATEHSAVLTATAFRNTGKFAGGVGLASIF